MALMCMLVKKSEGEISKPSVEVDNPDVFNGFTLKNITALSQGPGNRLPAYTFT